MRIVDRHLACVVLGHKGHAPAINRESGLLDDIETRFRTQAYS